MPAPNCTHSPGIAGNHHQQMPSTGCPNHNPPPTPPVIRYQRLRRKAANMMKKHHTDSLALNLSAMLVLVKAKAAERIDMCIQLALSVSWLPHNRPPAVATIPVVNLPSGRPPCRRRLTKSAPVAVPAIVLRPKNDDSVVTGSGASTMAPQWFRCWWPLSSWFWWQPWGVRFAVAVPRSTKCNDWFGRFCHWCCSSICFHCYWQVSESCFFEPIS